MHSPEAPGRSRNLDEIAEALPQRAAALSRLFVSRSNMRVSRTEAGVIWALSVRAQRITDLAAGEGVTQPAITRLVNRLEKCGWVAREDDPDDRRAVIVRLTPAGTETFEGLRAEYRALVHEEMATLPDTDVETLARATDVLDRLIARLQDREL
jgi:DNA-binding MarR family transcriptional regulator